MTYTHGAQPARRRLRATGETATLAVHFKVVCCTCDPPGDLLQDGLEQLLAAEVVVVPVLVIIVRGTAPRAAALHGVIIVSIQHQRVAICTAVA